MKTSHDGFPQCYSAQIVVDADSQLIMTAAVSAHASDQGQLPCLLDAVQAHYGHKPTQLLADDGYRHAGDLQELEHRGIDGNVALGRERKTTSGPTATRRMQTQQNTPQGQETYAQRPSAGLSASWAFANLGCAACTLSRVSGIWCVWP